MSFTSWPFALFAGVVFALYYVPALGRFQVPILVVASLVFYGYGQPELLPLLAIAVFGTYAALVLTVRDRRFLPYGIAFNLLLLAFFKYKFLFFAPPALTGSQLTDFLLNLPLPIGISFFVFHNISLLMDLAGQNRPAPKLSDVLLYIIFFPQLVSGPITRAQMFLPQIVPKRLADVPFVEAARWIIAGYFFKLFVANNLNEMTVYMDFPLFETLRLKDRWLLVFLYSYQIYADFFGYSAIALGLGLLFGYRLPVNFDLPYISRSFQEFWTRWHMSLSNWLRNYLYIPLGGNRHGPGRTTLNLMIVMGLGGLWHGAGLSYLIWGLLHGALLVTERPLLARFGKLRSPAFDLLRMLVVFACVSLLWIFFKLPDFGHALSYLQGMLTDTGNPNPPKIFNSLALIYALPVMLQHLNAGARLRERLPGLEPYVMGAMIALMAVEAGPDTAFIYFQF